MLWYDRVVYSSTLFCNSAFSWSINSCCSLHWPCSCKISVRASDSWNHAHNNITHCSKSMKHISEFSPNRYNMESNEANSVEITNTIYNMHLCILHCRFNQKKNIESKNIKHINKHKISCKQKPVVVAHKIVFQQSLEQKTWSAVLWYMVPTV